MAQPPPVSLRCPHCRQLGSFQRASDHAAISYMKLQSDRNVRSQFVVALRQCPNTNCRGVVMTLSRDERLIGSLPAELLDFDPDGLPQRCQDTLKEAIACHAAGAYRASAMMVRRLLEEVCEENEAAGANLHQRLEALKSKITLPKALFTAMVELKALGNDAAHVEAKDYDSVGKDEATLSLELAKEIVKALYQLEGLVGRLQALRKAP